MAQWAATAGQAGANRGRTGECATLGPGAGRGGGVAKGARALNQVRAVLTGGGGGQWRRWGGACPVLPSRRRSCQRVRWLRDARRRRQEAEAGAEKAVDGGDAAAPPRHTLLGLAPARAGLRRPRAGKPRQRRRHLVPAGAGPHEQ